MRSPPHPPADPRVLEAKVAMVLALTSLGRLDEARVLRADIGPALQALATSYGVDLRRQLDEIHE